MRDRLFESDQPRFESFEFNQDVASVFDDMVARNIPHYDEVQSLMAELALRCHGGHPIYDLGCSTGTTLSKLTQQSQAPLVLVGIDSSQAMLEACRAKLAQAPQQHITHILQADLNELESFPFGPPGAVILSLVAQFLRPVRRQQLLAKIYRQLVPGGCLLMLEKTVEAQRPLNSLFLDLYHEMKRANGYSDVEIQRKREALENRLIPFLPQENLELLETAGFAAPSVFFSWLNFQGYIAMKNQD